MRGGFYRHPVPEGAVPFYNMLADWREQGDLEGLILNSSA